MSVAIVVSRYRAGRGSLEVLALEGKGAQELLQSNPLAGFCLALNNHFRPPPVVCPIAAAWGMAYRPQREILAWLGFPGTEAVAKLGRKCVPESLTVERCVRLRAALVAKKASATLAHLPRINGGVIDLVTQREAPRAVTPQLLLEIATNPDEDGGETCALMVNDTQQMARVLRRERALARVRTRQMLREVHDEFVREMNRRKAVRPGTRPFPDAPVTGRTTPTTSIVPIQTREQLMALAKEQHNCVASYATALYRKEVFIYRVTHDGTVYTLAIESNRAGGWSIQQLQGVCNRNPPAQVSRAVYQWLQAFQPPPPAAEPAGPCEFPPAPVSGATGGSHPIAPVTNSTMLEELNLASYRRRIVTREMYAYRVSATEGVCAVVIRRGQGRRWQLDRVVPVGNHSVQGATLQVVADWLGRSQGRYR